MIRTNFEISQIEAWILLEIGSHMNLELISNIVKYMLETIFESIQWKLEYIKASRTVIRKQFQSSQIERWNQYEI